MTIGIYLCIGTAVIIITVLSVKIYLLKKSVGEIQRQLGDKLTTDTNTNIGVSSSDRDIRRLAADINVQLQELRRQKNRYIQGDMELKNAVTNISHDLRTPLTAISSYLDLLEKYPERSGQYLPVIRERTEALTQLIEELFRYSVIAAAEQDDKTEEVLVNEVLEECILGCYAPLAQRGITPVIDITENKIVRNVNRSALSRVFSNLLNNALKYSDGDLNVSMTDDGLITFSNKSAELSSVQVERLFERFYTVENARKSTGLGLSIAKLLIERMNGSITAEYKNESLKIYISIP